MKILTEAASSVAWCLHRSGKSIPVRVHPFGALDDDATEDAAWLYVVGDEIVNKMDVVGFLSNQLCDDYGIDPNWSSDEIIQIVAESLEDIECLKGVSGVSNLVDAVSRCVISMLDDAEPGSDSITTMSQVDIEDTGMIIKKHLNENYTRVRWGSEYQNYTEREGAIYFRTSSSDGFNWYPVILKFLSELPRSRKVREVTIERDQSATGDRVIYIDHMPLNDFLMNKPVVIESVIKCGTREDVMHAELS